MCLLRGDHFLLLTDEKTVQEKAISLLPERLKGWIFQFLSPSFPDCFSKRNQKKIFSCQVFQLLPGNRTDVQDVHGMYTMQAAVSS